MTEPTEKNLLDAARRLRHKSEHALDELTIARLRAARLNAIARAPERRRGWLLAGSFAAAGVTLAVAGLLWFRTPLDLPAPPPGETVLADLDLLATESPDFYDNLEFYQWLASQPGAG